MFHDLILNLEQDEQLHDMYDYVFHFYELIQDKIMMDNQELNLFKKIIKLKSFLTQPT